MGDTSLGHGRGAGIMRLVVLIPIFILSGCDLVFPGLTAPDVTPSDEYLVIVDSVDAHRTGEPLYLSFAVERVLDGEVYDICRTPVSPWCGTQIMDAQPILDGPSGRIFAEEVRSATGKFIDWGVPLGSAPGTYDIIGAAGVDLPILRGGRTIVIDDWGQAEGFDAADLNNTAWALTPDSWKALPAGFDALGQAYAPDLFVAIDSTDEGGAEFRLIADLGNQDCTVLRAEGLWNGSELRFSERELSAAYPDGRLMTGEDALVAIAWSTESADADLRASISIDTRPWVKILDTEGDDDVVCSLLETFGVSCHTCDDGEPFCMDMSAYQGQLVPMDEPFGLDLPQCGIDAIDMPHIEPIEITCGPDIDPDFGCSTTGGLGAQGILIALLVGLRRRRN
jgi:hypothetical protein